MENVQDGSGKETQNTEPTPNTAESGVSQDTATGQSTEEANSAQAQPASGEQENEFVKGDDGKEYIPREAFEARIKKLTEQKYQARDSFLEALRNDPATREEVAKALGVSKEQAPKETAPDQPSAFDKFLAPLKPEHQAHYRDLVSSIVPEFENYVETTLEKALAPIISALGEQQLAKFKASFKDADKYMPQMQKLITEGRARNLDDAYILASHDDKLKGVTAASGQKVEEIRGRSASLPVRGKNINPRMVGKNQPENLHDALMQAARDSGYLKS